MNLQHIERVHELADALDAACRVLAKFEASPGETVPAFAHTTTHDDYGRAVRVALPPVAKSVAVSAAKREVAKIVEQLAHLGVEVDETVLALRSVPEAPTLTLSTSPSAPSLTLPGGY